MSGKLKKVVMFIRIPYLWNNVLPYYLRTEVFFFFNRISYLWNNVLPYYLRLKFSLIEFLIYGVTYCLTTLELKFFCSRIPYLWNNVLPYYLKTEDLSLSFFKKHCRAFYKNKIRGFNPDRPHVTWAWNHGNYQFICVTFSDNFSFFLCYNVISGDKRSLQS